MYAVLVQTLLYFIQESPFLQSKLCKWEWVEEIRPHAQYVTHQGFDNAPDSKYLFRMCLLIINCIYLNLRSIQTHWCCKRNLNSGFVTAISTGKGWMNSAGNTNASRRLNFQVTFNPPLSDNAFPLSRFRWPD